MAGTKAGGQKAAETNKKKYGPNFYRNIGSQGGTKTYETGQLAQVNFKSHPERARIAGRKGGLASRRSK